MGFDSTFLGYFFNASAIVKCVMLLLLVASIMSWTYILQRTFYVSDVRKRTRAFENTFLTTGDLSKLYADGVKRTGEPTGLEAIFSAGFKEYLRLRQQASVSAEAMVESVKRAMRVAQMNEQDKLELNLPVLATIGSTSPFVGIFGTVWGIMLSFRALAHVQQATISMVAPGIAEALISTAMGLFAAIPAVIAYNRFAADINRLLSRFDAFQEEFSNTLFRHAKTAFQSEAGEA